MNLPALNPLLHKRFVVHKQDSQSFTDTYSEIESLLKNSRRELHVLKSGEASSGLGNMRKGSSMEIGKAKAKKRSPFKRKHYATRMNQAPPKLTMTSTFDSESTSHRKNLSQLPYEAYSKSLSQLPMSLRSEIVRYKTNTEELLDLERRVKERKKELKELGRNSSISPSSGARPDSSYEKNIIQENIHQVKTRDQLLHHNLEKLDESMKATRRREQELAELKQQQLEHRLVEKNRVIKQLSQFTSPKARQDYLNSIERHRQWLTMMVLANFVTQIEKPLFEHRVQNIEELNNDHLEEDDTDSEPTEHQQDLFSIYKRRVFMEYRRREQNPLDLNPFVARLKYQVKRKHLAASMIRHYCLRVAESKETVRLVLEYMHKIRQCQRHMRSFLVVKKARLHLLDLQLLKYQKEQQKLKKVKLKAKLRHLHNLREHVLDRKSKINAVTQKLNDPTSFFDIPQIVRDRLLREYLEEKLRKHVSIVMKMHSIRKTATTKNFAAFSKFAVKTTSQKPVYGSARFSLLMTREELSDVYHECISQSLMLAEENLISLEFKGRVVKQARDLTKKSRMQRHHERVMKRLDRDFSVDAVTAAVENGGINNKKRDGDSSSGSTADTRSDRSKKRPKRLKSSSTIGSNSEKNSTNGGAKKPRYDPVFLTSLKSL